MTTLKLEPNFAVMNKKPFKTVYKLAQSPLGKGSFGQVYSCTLIQDPSAREIKRAVKMIAKSGSAIRDRKKYLQETEALTKIAHPNILHIYEMFED